MFAKIYQPIIYSLLIIVGVILGSKLSPPVTINYTTNQKVNTVLDLINNHYVDSINYEKFNDTIISSILENLDPHSTYISLENIKSIAEDMQGSFSGIGVQFNIIEDTIVVIAAISGGPSERLGIMSGDRIIKVDNEDVAGIKIKNEGVFERLRGEKNSSVNVTIIRRGEKKNLEYNIIRDDIPLYSVDCAIMLNKEIGYVKINRFSATTFNEFHKNIMQLLEQNMKKIIIDLRGNPGGYLGMAIKICDEFLESNSLIVYTEGRNRERDDIYANGNGLLEDTKVVILIDEGSASASEIVAGAIQDNDRGLIIGRRSFGKGLVQEQIQLADGSAIRLTTQRYYTPSGRCIQKKYGSNNKEYYLESFLRNDDDKKDSLYFTTKKGRQVYGKGGISPDIIIKRDTTLDYSKINFMLSKGWINEFCINHAILLKKNQTNNQLIYIRNTEKIYNHFKKFVYSKNPEIEINLGITEKKYLKTLLKATISKSILGSETYYKIISEEDKFITSAIKELEKD